MTMRSQNYKNTTAKHAGQPTSVLPFIKRHDKLVSRAERTPVVSVPKTEYTREKHTEKVTR